MVNDKVLGVKALHLRMINSGTMSFTITGIPLSACSGGKHCKFFACILL